MPRALRFAVRSSLLLGLALLALGATALSAEETSTAKAPADSRIGALKDYDGYFPFEVPPTKEAWEARAEKVRSQIKVALGLVPEPTRHPLDPIVTKTVDRDGYRVRGIVIESFPGLYLTGSLYLPDDDAPGKSAEGKRAAILCPHGHWPDGRFYDAGEAGVRREIASGAERFEVGGRYPLQARCVQLARMGCVVFHYDMLGYADNTILSQDLVHGFKTQRPELSSPERWGLFSAQSELRGWSVMGLQTYNSLRAVDYVLAMPEVDPNRIGVTGASGGGTQTMILAAIEPRVAAAFPAVMVSTSMQGGCTCENASYLRIETGNIEFAALCAPRPQAMSGADDWTVEIETKGLPELRQLYALYGAEKNVRGKYFPFPHNYNNLSRMYMEDFFNEWFQLGATTPVIENDYVPLTREELSVWTDEHPRPEGGVELELALLANLEQDRLAKEATPEVARQGWDVLLGKALPKPEELELDLGEPQDWQGRPALTGTLVKTTTNERLPVAVLLPKDNPTGLHQPKVLVWTDPRGIASLKSQEGALDPVAAKALDDGYAIYAIDALHQGAFVEGGGVLAEAPVVPNPRPFAGYTLGFNWPLPVQRAHDVASLILAAASEAAPDARIELHAGEGAAYWALPAAYLVRDRLAAVSLASPDERFGSITAIRDPNLLPFAVRYGDLSGLAKLCAPVEVGYRN